MFNFQPLNDNVLLKSEPKKETTYSGIIIPDSAKNDQQKAEVVAIPPGSGEDLAVGDTVLFNQNNVTEIKDGDTLYLVLPFTSIIGKFVEVDAI